MRLRRCSTNLQEDGKEQEENYGKEGMKEMIHAYIYIFWDLYMSFVMTVNKKEKGGKEVHGE